MNTAPELKRGDVVQLKSGGPVMTVEKIALHMPNDPLPKAWCEWQDAGRTKRKAYFVDMLRRPTRLVLLSHSIRSWIIVLLGLFRATKG